MVFVSASLLQQVRVKHQPSPKKEVKRRPPLDLDTAKRLIKNSLDSRRTSANPGSRRECEFVGTCVHCLHVINTNARLVDTWNLLANVWLGIVGLLFRILFRVMFRARSFTVRSRYYAFIAYFHLSLFPLCSCQEEC